MFVGEADRSYVPYVIDTKKPGTTITSIASRLPNFYLSSSLYIPSNTRFRECVII